MEFRVGIYMSDSHTYLIFISDRYVDSAVATLIITLVQASYMHENCM